MGAAGNQQSPPPIKYSLKEVSGFRDVLTDHASVRTANTRIFQESKPETSGANGLPYQGHSEKGVTWARRFGAPLHRQRGAGMRPDKESIMR